MTHTEILRTDPTYRALSAEYVRLGNEVDAANDGALHHAHGADADRMVAAIHYRYQRAAAAFMAYRANLSN